MARAGWLSALVVALLTPAFARAADTRPVQILPPREPDFELLPPPRVTAPSPEPRPSATPTPALPTPDEPEKKPYTEGWHAGTPPGDLFHVWVQYWLADTHHGAAFEFDHHSRRVGAVHAHTLGYADTQPVFDGGFELDAGDYGWYSFDYWQLAESGRTHRITDGDHVFVDTLFRDGDVVESRVEQHYAKIRDGVDVRYRFPIGDEGSFDINFGPVMSLAMRYESMAIKSVHGPGNDGSHFYALTLVPGLRLGADLHATKHITVRVGSDIDWLPELPYNNPLSFTREPSVRLWHDVRAFFAVRVWFVEIDGGYRFFEAYSGQNNTPGGGRTREGIVHMAGFTWGASIAF